MTTDRALLEPLREAITDKDVELVKSLLARGAPAHDRHHPPIHAAAEATAAEVIAPLADHGAELNVLEYSGDTPLQTAIHHDNVEVFGALIAAGADPYARRGRYDQASSLMVAIATEKAPWVESVADAGSDHTRHSIPLAAYAAVNAPELLALLVEKGVLLDQTNMYGQTALTWLAHRRETEDAVSILLAAGADVTVRNDFGWTPAMVASVFGPRVTSTALGRAKTAPEVLMLEALRKEYLPDIQAAFAGVTKDGRDYRGQSWLAWAQTAETVEWLLAEGVDPLHRCPRGETALCHVQWREEACSQAVLDATTYPQSDLDRALRTAVADHRTAVAKRLVVAGARADNDPAQAPVLFAAVKSDDVELVQLLLDAGADPNAVDATSCSLFFRALDQRRAAKLVGCLLQAGADAKRRTPSGETLLDEFVRAMTTPEKKHVTCLELLLSAGADGRPRGEYRTALEEVVDRTLNNEQGWANVLKGWVKVETKARLKAAVAAEGGDRKKGLDRLAKETDAYLLGLWIHASLPTATKLVRAGAGREGEAGNSPLFATVDLDLEPMMKLLLDHDFNPNVRGPFDRSLLAHAASLGRHERIHELVEAGADPCLDGRGDVLLSALNSPEPLTTLRVLLDLGADPALKESTKTPLEHAQYRLANYRDTTGIAEVVARLERHGRG